jgi:hypothetical protein
MKIGPVIQQLREELPNYTDKFSTISSVDSLVTSGTTATATTTTAHGLSTGNQVYISGAVDQAIITSLDLVDNVATARTASDHGLLIDFDFNTQSTDPDVRVIGANESEFNGIFELLSVPNRTSFTYAIQSPDATATGTIRSFDYSSYRFFGAKQITVTSPTEFTFTVTSGYDGDIGGTILVHSAIRISGAATLDRADQSYTKYGEDQYWAFVIGGTTTSSKDRNILNDSVATSSRGVRYRLRLIDDFSIAVFAPSSSSISARAQYDDLEDIKINLFQSLLRFVPEQQYVSEENFEITFFNSEIASYNTSYIVGSYSFQVLQDVTYGDTIKNRTFFPARDIDYTMGIDFDGADGDDLEFSIDLDDDPDF